jgi:hypothetical protein
MKVKIPRHFARLVEYEGDPGWGEKREVARPERTYESKLTSFTARIRYPDMQGLTSDELRLDYKQATIYNTMWFSLGVSTGNHFGDGLFLERMKQAAKKKRYLVNLGKKAKERTWFRGLFPGQCRRKHTCAV